MYEAYSGFPWKEIYEQRHILATKHTYEAVLLKEIHMEERFKTPDIPGDVRFFCILSRK
jgi:hypothetical protein